MKAIHIGQRKNKGFGDLATCVASLQFYRTRANRAYCKEKGIRLSGSPPGRPNNDPKVQGQLKQQARDDPGSRR